MKRLVGSILIVALTLGLGAFREAGAAPAETLQKREAEARAEAERLAKAKEEMRARAEWAKEIRLRGSAPIYVPTPTDTSGQNSGDIPKDMDRVIMTNHDKLTGTLESITDGIISIQSPYVEEEIKVPLQSTTRIYFRKPSSQLAAGRYQVLFPGGEVPSGKLIRIANFHPQYQKGYGRGHYSFRRTHTCPQR